MVEGASTSARVGICIFLEAFKHKVPRYEISSLSSVVAVCFSIKHGTPTLIKAPDVRCMGVCQPSNLIICVASVLGIRSLKRGFKLIHVGQLGRLDSQGHGRMADGPLNLDPRDGEVGYQVSGPSFFQGRVAGST